MVSVQVILKLLVDYVTFNLHFIVITYALSAKTTGNSLNVY